MNYKKCPSCQNSSSCHDHSSCPNCPPQREQKHVHEVQGSVQLNAFGDLHNHRFATVSDEAVDCGNGKHFHIVKFRTDFYEDHFHEFCGKTDPDVDLGDRHVHFLASVTCPSDNHTHNFRLSTFMQDLISDEAEED